MYQVVSFHAGFALHYSASKKGVDGSLQIKRVLDTVDDVERLWEDQVFEVLGVWGWDVSTGDTCDGGVKVVERSTFHHASADF